jgi:hypothetical protein
VAITVPKIAQAGLALIRTLPDEKIDRIYTALQQTKRAPAPSELATIATERAGLDGEQSKAVGNTIASLYGLQAASDTELPALIDDVLSAMASSGSAALVIESGEISGFREKLRKLLSVPGLLTAYKARLLLSAHGNYMSSVKIITDMRPVFGSDPDVQPLGAILVNMMNVHYFEGGGAHREFTVALDQDDLKALKRAVDRAMRKIESLSKVLEKGGITRFEVD